MLPAMEWARGRGGTPPPATAAIRETEITGGRTAGAWESQSGERPVARGSNMGGPG